MRKMGRSLAIFALIFCLSLSLFMAAYIGISMKNGLESTEDRLGADIIVMPVDAQSRFEGALISGEPSGYYFEENIVDKVKGTEGVGRVSPQIYMASLSASCCSFPVQILGIDFDTDFSITPWLKGQVDELSTGEVLTGNNIYGEKGDEIQLFDQTFLIKEQLDSVGMGFDNSVFMSIEAARDRAKSASDKGVAVPYQDENLVSNIMVDVADGHEIDSVAREVNKNISGEGRARVTDTVITSVGDQMSSSTNYIIVLLAIVWILSIVVLLITFPMITRSRTGELATLRVLGATKKNISNILLREVGILSILGSIVGVIFGLVVSNLFSAAMRNSLDVPFLAPELGGQIVVAVVVIVLCSLIGPLSSLITINNLNKKELAVVYSEEN